MPGEVIASDALQIEVALLHVGVVAGNAILLHDCFHWRSQGLGKSSRGGQTQARRRKCIRENAHSPADDSSVRAIPTKELGSFHSGERCPACDGGTSPKPRKDCSRTFGTQNSFPFVMTWRAAPLV